MTIGINDLNAIDQAISDILGYLSDTSCSDPECCGGPFYEYEDYAEGVKTLAAYGLEFANDDH